MSKSKNAVAPAKEDGPDTIELKDSQRFALNALIGDQRRLQKEIEDRQQGLSATNAAITSVLGEVEQDKQMTPGLLGSAYQYDGKMLIRIQQP